MMKRTKRAIVGSHGITLKELCFWCWSARFPPPSPPPTILMKTTKILRDNTGILFKAPMIWQNNNGKNYGREGTKRNKQVRKLHLPWRHLPFPAILNFHFDSLMVAGMGAGVMIVKIRASTTRQGIWQEILATISWMPNSFNPGGRVEKSLLLFEFSESYNKPQALSLV